MSSAIRPQNGYSQFLFFFTSKIPNKLFQGPPFSNLCLPHNRIIQLQVK